MDLGPHYMRNYARRMSLCIIQVAHQIYIACLMYCQLYIIGVTGVHDLLHMKMNVCHVVGQLGDTELIWCCTSFKLHISQVVHHSGCASLHYITLYVLCIVMNQQCVITNHASGGS